MTQQNVLVDGAAIMQMPADQPSDPAKAIVESHATGPLVIDRSRVEQIV